MTGDYIVDSNLNVNLAVTNLVSLYSNGIIIIITINLTADSIKFRGVSVTGSAYKNIFWRCGLFNCGRDLNSLNDNN